MSKPKVHKKKDKNVEIRRVKEEAEVVMLAPSQNAEDEH